MAHHGHGGIGDGNSVTEIKNYSTETTHINQVELKVNDYVARFFLAIFVVEKQWPNAMVDDDDDRPEVNLLAFVVATGTCLASRDIRLIFV